MRIVNIVATHRPPVY